MKEARVRYERGMKLYEDGAYEQAMVEFERAYALAPAYRILYNIGQISVLLRDYPKAVRSFQQFLDEGGPRVPAKQRKEVETELDHLKARVAYVTVVVNVEGAEVLIDDVSVGTSPLAEPIVVNSGRHMVAVRKPGLVGDSESVVLAGQDEVEVELELTSPPVGGPAPVPLGPGDDPPRPQKDPEASYAWVGWLATATLAAGAVATGLLALKAKNDLDTLKTTYEVTQEELDDKHEERLALSISTDVLAGLAAVAAGVSIYLTVVESQDGDEEAAEIVRLRPTAGGLTLEGRF
jgi:hypothetical protein